MSQKFCRRADPSIQLIGWGDSGWAGRMIEAAGEHLLFLAFHHMFKPDSENQPVLRGELYRRDAEATWQQLMKAWKINDKKIRAIRENLGKHTMPPYSLPLFSYRLKSAATAPIYRSQPRDSTAPNASPFGCK